jgi:methylated-DNA-protein-cysteine methyltransferase related protein
MIKGEVINIIKTIPINKIASYGHIGSMLGTSGRVVGFIMTGLNELEVQRCPWWRVVNKKGKISSIKLGQKGMLQKNLLEQEGFKVQRIQIIDYQKYWHSF